jgi:tripartite-type tricarboxylate transporter receptor subunit TctC
MHTRKRWARYFLLLASASVLGGCGREAPYPNREIEFIIPFPPGGPTDTAVRIIQPKMSQLLGVPITLINRPGAGGALGADYVAKSSPDGYRVFATANNALTILPFIQRDLTYQANDFTPIGSFAADLNVIAVQANKRWRTLDELIEYAKKNPGKLTYGSAGVGTVSFFTIELLKLSLGLDIAHVPFSGTGPAKTALLGGTVDLSSGGFGSFGPLIQSGDLAPLVTTAAQRVPDYPDIPTMAEKGFQEASLNIWIGLCAPAATPREVVDRLAPALEETMQDPAVVKALQDAGMFVDYRNPEATRELLRKESESIRRAVEKLGIGN